MFPLKIFQGSIPITHLSRRLRARSKTWGFKACVIEPRILRS